MRKLSVLFISLILVLALSACGNNANDNNLVGGGSNQQNSSSQTTAITREKALEIALDKTGAAESDIRDLDIELDVDRGERVWEIDFEYGNLEYSYDVDAQTGAITKVERQRDN